MFTNPFKPNLADFTTFVYAQGVSASALPSTSPYLQWSLTIAEHIVMKAPPCIRELYVLAVYNYAMAKLVMIAQDVAGSNYFTGLREKFSLLNFTAGPVISSFDNSTGQTFANPDFIKGLQVGQLALLKTPWGVEYLDYAMSYGPNIVGVS